MKCSPTFCWYLEVKFIFFFFNSSTHGDKNHKWKWKNNYHTHQTLNGADCHILYQAAETMHKKNRKTQYHRIFFLLNLWLNVSSCVLSLVKNQIFWNRFCAFRPRVTDRARNPGEGGREDWFAVLRRLFGFFVSCLSCDETSTPSRRPNVVSSPL